jgi:16S rRNA G966 N2-methylase RsmD
LALEPAPYGDNLQVLREHITDESVNLIYRDPPFDEKRDGKLLELICAGRRQDV